MTSSIDALTCSFKVFQLQLGEEVDGIISAIMVKGEERNMLRFTVGFPTFVAVGFSVTLHSSATCATHELQNSAMFYKHDTYDKLLQN